MIPGAEPGGQAVWACEGDERVTPVGRLLRRIRLDELPQFWNILKGEMSLVGPRPERPEFVGGLVKVVPFYQARHAVRPGITGWAQVRYRYGSSVEDALVKLQYDLYYIKHQSVYLELSILVKTLTVVLGLKGR
jgi:lipopolysaccharide/colanic/teichoic acid biosynthesis glycosyltransferase